MTQPSTDPNAPLPWDTALRDVLGAENNFATANVADPTDLNRPTWMALNTYFTATSENSGARPWNHWMPQGVGGANDITIYRKRSYTNSEGYSVDEFQLIRGTVWFYNGGDNSPATQAQRLISASETIIGSIGSNQFLDRTTYQTASELFYNTWWWLSESAGRTLRNLVHRVAEDGSNFDGTAADALVWAMQVMDAGVRMLAQNIEGDADATRNWSIALRQNAEAIDTFKNEMTAAWAELKGANRYYDPNWLIREILLEMERQVDADDRQTSWSDAEGKNPSETWNFSFPNQGLPGPYNLLSPEQWGALDRDMKAGWRRHIDTLDQRSREATRKLIASFDHTWTIMARSIPPFADRPYQSPTPDPSNTGGGPDINGASGPDGLPDIKQGGGGSDLPDLNQGSGGGGGSDLPNLNSGSGSSGGTGLPNLISSNSGTGLPGIGNTSSSSGAKLPGVGDGSFSGGLIPVPGRGSGGSGISLPPTRRLTPDEVRGLGGRPLSPSGSGMRGEPQEVRKSGMTLGALGLPPSASTDLGQLAGGSTSALVAGGVSPGGAATTTTVGGANGVGGAAGAGGIPFMPPMGGMGAPGANQEKERERNTWLSEEEEVWGTDPDCSPAVVGRDETAEPGDKPGRTATRPGAPLEPARATPQRRTTS